MRMARNGKEGRMNTRPIHLYGGPLDGKEISVPLTSGNVTLHDGSRYTITDHCKLHGVAIYAYAGTHRSLNIRKGVV